MAVVDAMERVDASADVTMAAKQTIRNMVRGGCGGRVLEPIREDVKRL